MAHERTMPGPKLTRMALRSTAGADISPLMAFVPDRSWRLSRLFGQARTQPILDEGIDPSGDSHTVRRINDPEMLASISAVCAAERLYIADGHHRYESALETIDRRAGSRNVLMGIVCATDPGLVVGATHRMIHASTGSDLLEKLQERFNVVETSVEKLQANLPDGSSAMGLITGEGTWLLRTTEKVRAAMPGHIPVAWRNLAPAVLQYAVLEPLLGIDADAVAGGRALSYTHDIDDLLASVNGGEASAGSSFPPRPCRTSSTPPKPAASCRRRAPISYPSSRPAW